MKKNKGLSLIELILTINLLMIIIGLLFSFLINNINYFNIIYNRIEIKEQGEFAINYMTERLMTLTEITDITDKYNYTLNHINRTNPVNIRKIIFSGINTYNDYETNYKFELKTNNKLFDRTTEVACYITDIIVCPMPKEVSYKNAKGIKIILKLNKGKEYREISKTIYFRNRR
ncbi:MAG: hypothetical protein FH751_07975 [Firmicutes bacterium]|nr:hypothetical protein [Bacillota bacterium]